MTWTWLGIAVCVFLVFSGYMGYRRGFIKEIVSIFFVFLSIALVWVINPYINDFIRQNTPVYSMVQEGCRSIVQSQAGDAQRLNSEEQRSLIDDMKLPGLLKKGLEENNTTEVYRYLSVDSFTEYVANYLAVVVVNGISFLISYLLATILIRMVTYALNLIAGLPILNGANKAAGGILGVIKGLIFIWIAFLLLTVFCNTDIGKQGLKLVSQDFFLNLLYENNIFVKIFMNIFYGK
mgnify:CR=1 FL=1